MDLKPGARGLCKILDIGFLNMGDYLGTLFSFHVYFYELLSSGIKQYIGSICIFYFVEVLQPSSCRVAHVLTYNGIGNLFSVCIGKEYTSPSSDIILTENGNLYFNKTFLEHVNLAHAL